MTEKINSRQSAQGAEHLTRDERSHNARHTPPRPHPPHCSQRRQYPWSSRRSLAAASCDLAVDTARGLLPRSTLAPWLPCASVYSSDVRALPLLRRAHASAFSPPRASRGRPLGGATLSTSRLRLADADDRLEQLEVGDGLGGGRGGGRGVGLVHEVELALLVLAHRGERDRRGREARELERAVELLDDLRARAAPHARGRLQHAPGAALRDGLVDEGGGALLLDLQRLAQLEQRGRVVRRQLVALDERLHLDGKHLLQPRLWHVEVVAQVHLEQVRLGEHLADLVRVEVALLEHRLDEGGHAVQPHVAEQRVDPVLRQLERRADRVHELHLLGAERPRLDRVACVAADDDGAELVVDFVHLVRLEAEHEGEPAERSEQPLVLRLVRAAERLDEVLAVQLVERALLELALERRGGHLRLHAVGALRREHARRERKVDQVEHLRRDGPSDALVALAVALLRLLLRLLQRLERARAKLAHLGLRLLDEERLRRVGREDHPLAQRVEARPVLVRDGARVAHDLLDGRAVRLGARLLVHRVHRLVLDAEEGAQPLELLALLLAQDGTVLNHARQARRVNLEADGGSRRGWQREVGEGGGHRLLRRRAQLACDRLLHRRAVDRPRRRLVHARRRNLAHPENQAERLEGGRVGGRDRLALQRLQQDEAVQRQHLCVPQHPVADAGVERRARLGGGARGLDEGGGAVGVVEEGAERRDGARRVLHPQRLARLSELLGRAAAHSPPQRLRRRVGAHPELLLPRRQPADERRAAGGVAGRVERAERLAQALGVERRRQLRHHLGRLGLAEAEQLGHAVERRPVLRRQSGGGSEVGREEGARLLRKDVAVQLGRRRLGDAERVAHPAQLRRRRGDGLQDRLIQRASIKGDGDRFGAVGPVRGGEAEEALGAERLVPVPLLALVLGKEPLRKEDVL
mmetsp:Transcript_9784/g.32445  ORF Transcript_9784/g.32445 Transcript_9784/m.32445 type:complete len:925 (-) Transcript_9784:727-3501(-)